MADSLGDGTPVRATVPVAPGRGRPQASGGRICEHPGCGTVLSVYNHSGSCWVHQDGSARVQSERFSRATPAPNRSRVTPAA